MRFALLLLMIFPMAGFASAETHTCELYEVRAEKGNAASFDQKLPKSIVKKLKRPTFAAWNRFTLANRKNTRAAQRVLSSVKTLNGNTFSVLIKSVSKSQGQKKRFAVSINIDNKAGKRILATTVMVDAENYVVIGGDRANSQGMFKFFSCR